MSHKDTYKKMSDAILAKDYDTYRTFLASDVVNHNPAPGMTGKGPDAVIGEMKMWLDAFSGVEATPIHLVEEGNFLAVHARNSGTNTASIMGQPPTNKKIDITTTEIIRFNDDGKVAERWGNVDMMSMMQQLGMMPG